VSRRPGPAGLAGVVATAAAELPADHVIAWARVLEGADHPSPAVEAALIDARGGLNSGVNSGWRMWLGPRHECEPRKRAHCRVLAGRARSDAPVFRGCP
jgi:hypothetical protein